MRGISLLTLIISNQALAATLFWFYCINHRQTKSSSKIKVSLISTRHSHNRTSTVAHQHIIRNKNRNLRAGNRVGGIQSREITGLSAVICYTIHSSLSHSFTTILTHSLAQRFITASPCLRYISIPISWNMLEKWMVYSNHSKSCTEQSIGTRGIYFHILSTVSSWYFKMHSSTMRFTDPIALHSLNFIWPINAIEVFNQAMTVGSNAHGPLRKLTLKNREITALRLTFSSNLFISKNSSQTWAPVHRRLRNISQTELVEHIVLLLWLQIVPSATFETRNLLVARAESINELRNRSSTTHSTISALVILVIPRVENASENPLRPVHILRLNRSERTTII